MSYGTNFPPHDHRTTIEGASAEDKRRRELAARGQGTSFFWEIREIVEVVLPLPWRVFRWIGSKVAREDPADRPDAGTDK